MARFAQSCYLHEDIRFHCSLLALPFEGLTRIFIGRLMDLCEVSYAEAYFMMRIQIMFGEKSWIRSAYIWERTTRLNVLHLMSLAG